MTQDVCKSLFCVGVGKIVFFVVLLFVSWDTFFSNKKYRVSHIKNVDCRLGFNVVFPVPENDNLSKKESV